MKIPRRKIDMPKKYRAYLKQWIKLYKSGYSLEQLAEQCDISRETIRIVLIDSGIVSRSNEHDYKSPFRNEIPIWIKAAKAGKTPIAIAAMPNVTATAEQIYTKFVRMNVEFARSTRGPKEKPGSIGALAYHMRKDTDLTWEQIAYETGSTSLIGVRSQAMKYAHRDPTRVWPPRQHNRKRRGKVT